MKTLHITNSWHSTSGGIGTFYRELLAAANRSGHTLRLVVPGDRAGVEEVRPCGRIYHVRGVAAPFNNSYRLILPGHYLSPGRAAVREILQTEQPDVVEVCDKYCFNYLGGLLRRRWLPGVPFRPTVVGLTCERMDENVMAYLSGSPLALALTRSYMKHLYFPLFDHHIANSDHTAAELRPASQGHDVRRGVWVCPMGVDCDGLGPAHRCQETRTELESLTGGHSRSVLLFYAGRLAPEKHLWLLPAVMEILSQDITRDYRLLVAGAGIQLGELRAACESKAPGRVHFLGHIRERSRLAALYANSDVFVHPNPCEPFGIAPLEAMASGTALVAPNSGGVLTYANAANSWLAPANPQSFAAAIADAVAGADRSRKLAMARATAESYRWENVTTRFFSLYEDLHAFQTGKRREPSVSPRFYSVHPTEA